MTNSENINSTSLSEVHAQEQRIGFTHAIKLQQRIKENLKKVGIDI